MTEINIDQLASLARLNVAAEEHDKLAQDVASILDYVRKIQETDAGEDDYKVSTDKIVRSDEVNEWPDKDIIKAFSASQGDLLKAPAISAKETTYDA